MLQVINLINVRLAQLDRAFGYGPKGREFESSNAHKTRVNIRLRGFFCWEIADFLFFIIEIEHVFCYNSIIQRRMQETEKKGNNL